MKKITLSNILSFARGHSHLMLRKLGMQPQFKKEQIAYRLSVCADDCVKTGKCKHCGCPAFKKMHDPVTCGGGRYPSMMSPLDWEKYKKDNNIIINDD